MILQMNQTKIDRMTENIWMYYDDYLTTKSVIKHLESYLDSGGKTVHLYDSK